MPHMCFPYRMLAASEIVVGEDEVFERASAYLEKRDRNNHMTAVGLVIPELGIEQNDFVFFHDGTVYKAKRCGLRFMDGYGEFMAVHSHEARFAERAFLTRGIITPRDAHAAMAMYLMDKTGSMHDLFLTSLSCIDSIVRYGTEDYAAWFLDNNRSNEPMLYALASALMKFPEVVSK